MHDNLSFVGDAGDSHLSDRPARNNYRMSYGAAVNGHSVMNGKHENHQTVIPGETSIELQQSNGTDSKAALTESSYKRDKWGKGAEFLFSCIAMSVGLGNIWRFPFIAFENGGGAFLLPYVIVLFIIGKPGFFLEMVVGQFSSRGTTKVYDLCPAMRGVGTGQVLSLMFVTTYYFSIMGLTLKYLVSSFTFDLPWATCRPEWGANCTSAASMGMQNKGSAKMISSAELYFKNEIFLKQTSLTEGIGHLNWELVAYLTVAWMILLVILIRGIKSSGKISYFLAIFPYVMLSLLLFNTCQLPGAIEGLKIFFTPQWDALWSAKVWYEAVTQVFFTLNVYYVTVIAYASYNKFDHKIQVDANIVTAIDTFTSLLSGCCVFSVLGYLKHELGVDDIKDVLKSGPGLAFITYPEAISKFGNFAPYLSVAFFLMFFILGIGSLVAMTSSIVTAVRDHFNKVTHWQGILVVAFIGITCGSAYYTQSGMDLIGLVDHYGATFVVFNLVIFELGTFCYIYGVDRLCRDIKFMLNFEPGLYWTVCWKYLTPGSTLFLVLYYYFDLFFGNGGSGYELEARLFGYFLATVALCHLPLIMLYETYHADGEKFKEKFRNAFRPQSSWGPRDKILLEQYKEFVSKSEMK